MVKRRGFAAYILDSDGRRKKVTNHTFRATGITTFLEKGGTFERAQIMANHSSVTTTQLYDRRGRTSPRPMWRGFSMSECLYTSMT